MTTKAQFNILEQKTLVQEDHNQEIEGHICQKLPKQSMRHEEAINQKFEYQYDHFVDMQFSKNIALSNLRESQTCQWKRACEGLSGQLTLFGVISPKDVSQGSLGDNYLLSVIQSMAQYPESIKQLFENTEYESDGLYCVHILGQRILIDDYFPFQGNLAFAKSIDNKLWVILLEKAYAKYFGSYEQIVGGLITYAFSCLTMAFSETQDISQITDKNEFWTQLQDNLNQKYLLNVSCQKSEQSQLGIINNHTYSIFGCSELENSDRLILLRNPWGRSNWNGKEYQKIENDQGQFWMSLEDFLNEFSFIFTNKIQPHYVARSIDLQFNKNEQLAQVMLSMIVKSKTQAHISVTQKIQKNSKGQTKISVIHLTIGKLHPQTKEVVQFMAGSFDDFAGCDQNYEIGEYVIYIEVDWAQEEGREMVLSYYGSSSDVEIKQFSLQQEQIKPYAENIFEGLIRAHARENQGKINTYQEGLSRYSGNFCGYYYFWYQNKTNDTTLIEKMKFNTRSMQIGQPYQNEKNALITCHPLSTCMVKLKAVERAFSYSCQSQSTLTVERSEQDIIKHALMRPEARETSQSFNKSATIYTIRFNDGIALVYENNENKIYKETLTIKAKNFKGVNFNIDEPQEIQVLPGSYKAIQFKIIEQFGESKIQFSRQITLV